MPMCAPSTCKLDRSGADFDVMVEHRATNESRIITGLRLPMFGQHNVQNALAAIAVAQEMGLPDDTIRRALSAVRGREAPLHQDRRGAWHHRDRRLRPSPGRDRRRAARRPPGLWRLGTGHRRHAAASLLAPVRAARRVRHLLLRRRCRDHRRRLCRGRSADRRRQSRHAGRPRAARRPSRRGAAWRTGRSARALVWQTARPGDVVVCLGAGNITAWAHALPGQIQQLAAEKAGPRAIANDSGPHGGSAA